MQDAEAQLASLRKENVQICKKEREQVQEVRSTLSDTILAVLFCGINLACAGTTAPLSMPIRHCLQGRPSLGRMHAKLCCEQEWCLVDLWMCLLRSQKMLTFFVKPSKCSMLVLTLPVLNVRSLGAVRALIRKSVSLETEVNASGRCGTA